jgi:AraC-like DNA-binding protein
MFGSMLNPSREPIRFLASGAALPRHLHVGAYATLVLEGGYEEAGDGGRWCVRPGEVLIHAPFSIHRNRSLGRGARLVNLPLPLTTAVSACRVAADADLVARLAENDPSAAAMALLEGWQADIPPLDEAPDRLAEALSCPDAAPIKTWSEAEDVARQTVFRGFRALYGVAPTPYRVEARARRAWRLILAGGLGLAEVALEAGYADQAHMSRDVKALTGRSPGAWADHARLHHSFTPTTPTA